MTATRKPRQPAAFELDDPRVQVAPPEPPPLPAAAIEEAELPAVALPPAARPRFRWGALFWSAVAGLALLGVGLTVVGLVEDLFARSQALGLLGLALAGAAGLALAIVLAREIVGLARLASVDAIRRHAAAAVTSDDRAAGRAVVDRLLRLTRATPSLARGRARLESYRNDIIDGRDLVELAERALMPPLDAEARRLIAGAAKRVSVVTAVSPRASIDMLFVFINALGLMRRLAALYGARPGMLGLVRLVRHVVTHLALTGGMAATDSLIQQVIGHGLAAKLSARLGEGVLNGLLTARLGLAAVEVTRPLPFSALPRPTLNDLAGGLLRSSEDRAPARRPARESGSAQGEP